ncbi:hypothetical protein [Qipengyuania spongiae]|uniref:Uncharacterized protein n=1 Tax=Qipengyuania spongiae TaxID=2909673 RepID=A0ABY5T277_9SPHN|nr:hypothetical protein [Qipengyuania spongiae]UVI39366.1 hypothetical protein L1F33_14240 [Qipengyuania spongiae]
MIDARVPFRRPHGPHPGRLAPLRVFPLLDRVTPVQLRTSGHERNAALVKTALLGQEQTALKRPCDGIDTGR